MRGVILSMLVLAAILTISGGLSLPGILPAILVAGMLVAAAWDYWATPDAPGLVDRLAMYLAISSSLLANKQPLESWIARLF